MKAWISIFLLIVIAAAAAFGWQWVAQDPGYVLIRLRGTSLETSLVFALFGLLFSWGLFSVLWRLLSWPARTWIRSQQKRARGNLVAGLTSFAEGRYVQAERSLAKAAKQAALRGPALLVMARSAHARGDNDRAAKALDDATVDLEDAALAQRAKFLVERSRHTDALTLLKPKAATGKLPPVGYSVLIEAALAESDVQTALDALPALAKTQSLAPAALAALEIRVYAVALATAASPARLNVLWSTISRASRKNAQIIAAYARRAASFGQTLAAMDEIESSQRREWSEELALCYGDLGPAELVTRTRHAEAWLSIAPNSAALLTTLGRLCRDQKLWGKGIQYLDRAVEIAELAPAWEALGDCHAASAEEKLANRCYSNALLILQGKSATALTDRMSARVDTHALIVEERDHHGVPRLPKTG